MLKRFISILWPSFLIAGVADVLFFTLFDPTQLLYKEEAVFKSHLSAYTVGFFLFWLMNIGSSSLTCYFQRGSDEINRCAHQPQTQPDERSK